MSPDDRIVRLLSEWLARHLDNEQLLTALQETDLTGLDPEAREAVEELVAELPQRGRLERGGLEVLVRETIELLALGGC
jgi:hypothetical protein